MKTLARITLALALTACSTTAVEIPDLPTLTSGAIAPTDLMIVAHPITGVGIRAHKFAWSDLKTALNYQIAISNPPTNGWYLTRSTSGVFTWVAPPTAGEPPLGKPPVDGWQLYSDASGFRYWDPPASLADLQDYYRTDTTTNVFTYQYDDDNVLTAMKIGRHQFYDTGSEVMNVKSWKASGIASTTTLSVGGTLGTTSAFLTANTFKKGQGIYITGAGPSGGKYVGTVTQSLPGATSVEITPPTSTATSTGTVVKHDDTAAIQAAIDHASINNIVYLPEGIYRCTSTLTTGTKTQLRGCGSNNENVTAADGSQVTTLDFRDFLSGDAISVGGNADMVIFSNFRMRGPHVSSNATTGIRTNSAVIAIENVTVYGFGEGINYYATHGRHVGVKVDANYQKGLWLRDGCQNFTSIDSVYANTTAGPNIRITGATDVSFYDRLVDEAFNSNPAIQVDYGDRISFNNCLVFSSRGSYGINLGDDTNTPTHVTLNNLHFVQYDNTGPSSPIISNIRLRGSGHRLMNVTTLIPPSYAGTDINDAATGTVMFNVLDGYGKLHNKFQLPTASASVSSGELYSNSGVVTVKP